MIWPVVASITNASCSPLSVIANVSAPPCRPAASASNASAVSGAPTRAPTSAFSPTERATSGITGASLRSTRFTVTVAVLARSPESVAVTRTVYDAVCSKFSTASATVMAPVVASMANTVSPVPPVMVYSIVSPASTSEPTTLPPTSGAPTALFSSTVRVTSAMAGGSLRSTRLMVTVAVSVRPPRPSSRTRTVSE